MVFEGLSELLEEGFSGGDEVAESGSLVSKRLFLVFEVGEEGFPILLALLFTESGGGLFFDDGGSDGLEEVQNLHDVFVVELGGKLSERGDEGLEKGGSGGGGFLEFFEYFVVSDLNLGEGNTVDHVLDELDALFEGGNLDGLGVIFFSPFVVFSFTLGCAGGDGVNGLVVILVGLFKVNLGLFNNFGIIANGSAEGGNGIGLFADLFSEAGEGIVTGGLIGSVLFVSLGLGVFKVSNNLVQQKGDFFHGVLGNHVQGNSADEGGAEVVLVNLSKDGLGVHVVGGGLSG